MWVEDFSAPVCDGSFEAIGLDGAVNMSTPDAQWWPYASEFLCRFGGVQDLESGVAVFETTLHVAPGDGRPPYAVGPVSGAAAWAVFTGLSLQQGDKLLCEVTATNNARVSATFSSNGATVD